MRVRTKKSGISVNAIAGSNVVMLGFDLSDARRKGCLGFAIQREDHTDDERYWMKGMKTFEATDPGLGPGGQVSSREHPFQGFQWADYSAKPGYDYTYNVIPLYGQPAKLRAGPKVGVPVKTEDEVGPTSSVFFNRGAVASQEYARRFLDKAPDQLEGEAQAAAYKWLSRGLLEALLTFLDRAKGADYEIHGAVYEFQWPAALAKLKEVAAGGASVQVVYDGIKPAESTARKNLDAITAARIKGLTIPRTTGKIMHNKFFVLSRKGKPVAVWTGSTNLTENGIFGHLNCGHIVEDETVARAYLDYWDELSKSPEDKTEKDWMDANNPNPPDPWEADVTTIFSPHRGQKVLDWYAEIAGSAKQGLFMTFAFGMENRFKDVYRRDDDILRMALMEQEGVGSALEKEKQAIREIRARPNVVVAVGHRVITNSFDRWLEERGGLTNNVEWIHTKFMLVDPLSDSPVIVTGSANFSKASTSDNNENMLVVRGDTRAADIYMGEYMRCYSHHAFREAIAIAQERGETEWRPQFLAPDDGWQKPYFDPGNDRSLRRQYFS
ncbi:MAG: hypothetical protein QOG46_2328 [Pseudonocardiales bacterium]|nr:hypothetical protein [Pseudonocardiales bacterium]